MNKSLQLINLFEGKEYTKDEVEAIAKKLDSLKLGPDGSDKIEVIFQPTGWFSIYKSFRDTGLYDDEQGDEEGNDWGPVNGIIADEKVLPHFKSYKDLSIRASIGYKGWFSVNISGKYVK